MTEQTAPLPSSTYHVGLRIKIIVGFTLLFSVIFWGAFIWFYTFATNSALQRITEDLKTTLEGASKGIDGDELLALYTDGKCPPETGDDGCRPFDDPRYLNQVKWLVKVSEIEPRASPYTYVRGEGEKELIFITSGGALQDPPFGAQFQEHYTANNPDPNYQGLQETTLETEPYEDEFGYWISGYTPVYNSKGVVVAALGIDFHAEYVQEVQRAIQNTVVIAFILTYSVLLGLIYIIAGALTNPIRILTKAAERIGEGDYKQDISSVSNSRFPDEISTLARVFTIMVGKVYQREQTLIKQVEELKIEIDDVKRLKQVNEITDNEFFRELQEKSRAMRRRRSEPVESPGPPEPGEGQPPKE